MYAFVKLRLIAGEALFKKEKVATFSFSCIEGASSPLITYMCGMQL